MRKYGRITRLIIMFLLCLLFIVPAVHGATGSIRAKIVLPGDPGSSGTLSIGVQKSDVRWPRDGGDGGGGDGGGGGSDGGGGGDGGYYYQPWDPIPPVTIGEDRILKLENLTDGLYNLILQYGRASNDEYQLALKNIRVVEGQVTDLKDLLMKKGGTIYGSIGYAGRSDFPTATVHVVGFSGTNSAALPVWLNSRTITATDLAGVFTLTNLPAGTYTLAITPGGDAAATHAREIIANVRVEADLSTNATPFGPIELVSTVGRLTGSVVLSDRPDGPSDGTFVRATSSDGRFRSYVQVTDAGGYYDFGTIPVGSYHLYIQHAGYKVSESDVALSSAGSNQGEIWLRKGTRKICGRISLAGAGWAGGDVTGDGQVGVADAVLALRTASGSQTAPAVGGDANGDGRIGVSEALFAMQTAATLRQQPVLSLAGTLVMIPGTSLMAATDSSGDFTIEGVPEKSPNNWTYDLFITRDGYQALRREGIVAQETCTSGSLPVTLSPHETTTVGGQVVYKGSIMGRAWLKNSADDYRNIDVAIENTGLVAKPNANGNFIFTDMPPGTYTLNFTNAGYKTVVEAGVLVVPNLTTETRNVLLIPRNGTIRGQIKLEGATDWSGIPIRVEPVEAQVASYQTDLNGYFSIPVPENYSVPTNTKCVLNSTTGACTTQASYTVVAGGGVWAHSDYQSYTFTNVNVPAGETVDLGSVEMKKPPAPPSGVAAAQADGASVTVSWTASPSTDVVGYNVYYGTGSGAINQKANAALISAQTGGKWQYAVTGIEKGIPYYFAVLAVDGDDLESTMAPADGGRSLSLIPDGTKVSQVTCINCSFESAYLTDIVLVGDGSRGYVSSPTSASIYQVDFSAGTADEANKIYMGANADLRALAFNPVRNELYVVNGVWGGATLRTVDTLTNTLKTNGVSIGAAPRNVIVSPDGTTIYVCSAYSGQNRITVIDAATSAVAATIPLGNIDPYGMAIARNKLYVVGTTDGWVYVIDLDSASPNYRKVIKNINAGVGAYDAVARTDGAYVYISLDKTEGAVAVIDTASDQLAGSPITVGRNPMGMAVSGNILYVVNYLDPSNQISMINTATNTKLETGAISSGGTNPKALAVSPDGNKLYVAHEGKVAIVSY